MKFVDKRKVFAGWDSMDGLIKAATWGDPAAQCRLGELYMYGFNTAKIDYAEAVKWFRLAADQGFARAKGKLGLMNEYGQGMLVDERCAAVLYGEAAEQNDGCALLNLGLFYQHGRGGLQKDKTKAGELHERAYSKLYGLAFHEDNAVAQNLIGFMYSLGCGVNKNAEQAVVMYRLAAQQGHAVAEYNLGCMYNEGDGVAYDPDAAFFWFSCSAKQGHRGGYQGLAELYAGGWGAKEAPKLAVEMWQKAGELGESRSQLMLGLGYLEGEYDLPVDHEQAVYWLALAAERGERLARRKLGTCQVKPTCPLASSENVPFETYTNLIGMDFVKLPAGTFQMGSGDNDEESYPCECPRHEVRISHPFYLGTTPVTQAQWEVVMGNNPSDCDCTGAQCPVVRVSWHEAQEFVRRLNEVERHERYRLPTEAEWEYACRAGSSGQFYFDDDDELDDYEWHCNNTHEAPQPVGMKKPNPWGLYDMGGNVQEWLQDWYTEQYKEGAECDPAGPESGDARCVRGGSWLHGSWMCRSAARDYFDPATKTPYLGFRVALSVDDMEPEGEE